MDLERVASFTKCSPSMSAFLAGFLPSAQNLPGPLFSTSPALADLSPLPFATLHRPESAAAYPKSSAGLPTPTMISLTFGGALNVPFLYHLRPLFVLGSQPAKAAAQGCQHFIWHGRISSLKSLLFML